MTATGSVGLVFVGEVLAERSLGVRAIFCSAARADLARSISDDPDRALAERAVGVSLFGSKPQASSFSGTRHRSLICSICASVVKSLPAMRSTISRPRAASRRNPEAVIEPSGNAIAAAMPSRSGVLGPISSRAGNFETIAIPARKRETPHSLSSVSSSEESSWTQRCSSWS